MGGIFSKPKTETRVESSLPEWANQMGEDAANLARDINKRGYVPYDGKTVAGLSSNQQKAINNAVTTGLSRDYFQPARGYANNAAKAFTDKFSANPITFRNVSSRDVSTSNVNADTVDTAQWNADAIDQYMSPYIEQALDPALREIEEAAKRSYNDIGSKAAARGAFGSLRQGLLEARNEENMLQQLGDTAATGYRDAYNTAFQNFTSDKDRLLRRDLANQDTSLRANMANQDSHLRADLSNQDSSLRAALANQAGDIDVGKFNESQRLNAFDANMRAHDMNARNALSAAGALQGLAAGEVAKTNANFDRLMKSGSLQQLNRQAQMDDAYSRFMQERDENGGDAALNRLLSTIGVAQKESYSHVDRPNKASEALGTALTLGKMFMGSDIRLKDNILPIGNKNGFNLYSFNYKGSNKKYIGVMAQEVKEKAPHAVAEMDNGYLAVDYKAINIPFIAV